MWRPIECCLSGLFINFLASDLIRSKFLLESDSAGRLTML